MKKGLLLLLFPGVTLLGQVVFIDINPTNNLYTSAGTESPTLIGPTPITSTAIFFTISLSPSGVTISVTSSESELDDQAVNDLTPSGSVATPSLDTSLQLFQDPTTASVTVEDASITKTLAQIAKDGSIALNFTIVSMPDSTVSTGFSLVLQMLLQRLNIDLVSPDFFSLQAFQIDGFGDGIIYHSINQGSSPLKYWSLPPEGLILSPTWNTSQLLQVVDNSQVTLPTQTTLSLVITNDQVAEAIAFLASENVTSATYWTSGMIVMETYDASIALQQKLLDVQNQNIELTFLTQLDQQATILVVDPLNNFYPLTPPEIATILANKEFLDEEIAELESAQADTP